MLITLAAPAFAKEWYIEDGNITVKAGDTKGTNKVSQGESTDVPDTDTVITNREKNASSNTVTIEAKDKDDKVEVTLKDVNIDTSSRNKAAVSVTGEGDTNIKLNGDNALKSDIYRSGIYGSGSGSLTISGGENDSLTAQGGSGANGICVAKMFDKTSSIICAFGLAAAAPRSPYRHLELCGIALTKKGYATEKLCCISFYFLPVINRQRRQAVQAPIG